MRTLNISLPQSLAQQVNWQVQTGNYASVSEFIREAVRKLLGITPTTFAKEAEEEILKISKTSPTQDFVFDSSKIPVKKMFTKLKKAKV